ncbi:MULTISPECIES: siderophore-interacting protein [Lysobacter]|uniref:siderophore-interacting protein n=1 Tax=Lysobacter TaxID=68 RepID=UPI001F3117C7|nr:MULTISPECIES: siderophore-interacting protein [Lysobacter]UJB17698.1 siderophore-interacting protein [Lysobacter capsici]UJQ28580.1 siderophore-interacting protein [Lysobacter gummosus]
MHQSALPARQTPGAGLLERAFTRLLMRPVRITSVQAPDPDFRLIAMQGEALKRSAWSPGDKIQLKLDGGLQTRTFTPIELDPASGRMRILAYCHGGGPASDWARGVAEGEVRQIFGPRGSLNLQNLASCTVVFGDETSFALAAALQRDEPGLRCVFEVASPERSQPVLDLLGINRARLIERRADDTHLDQTLDAIQRSAEIRTSFVLTGRAPAIQRIGRALKAQGLGGGALRIKPYWAPGRTGLD